MRSLWHELTAASWVANTGIPLLLTLAALVFGFWSVRRQLQHDRLLMTAENLARAARTLGATVLRAAMPLGGVFRSEDPSTTLGVPVWRSLYWFDAGGEKITVALWEARAAGLVGDLIDGLEQTNHALERAWARLRDLRRQTVRDWGEDPMGTLDVPAVMAVGPHTDRLNALAGALLRWDGLGPLPSIDSWTEPTNEDIERVWRDYVAHFDAAR